MTDLVLERLLKQLDFKHSLVYQQIHLNVGKELLTDYLLVRGLWRYSLSLLIRFSLLVTTCSMEVLSMQIQMHADIWLSPSWWGIGGQWWKRGSWMHIWLDCEMIPVGDSGVFQSQYIESEKEVQTCLAQSTDMKALHTFTWNIVFGFT